MSEPDSAEAAPPGSAATEVASRRGRPRDADADRRILDAAAALMLADGVQATTVDAVAARAGVAKATVYRRWTSKEDLVVDALGRVVDVQVPVPDTGSLRGDLTAVYLAALAFLSSEPGRAFVRVGAAEAARDERVAEVYQAGLRRRLAEVAPVLDRAVQRGELPADADRALLLDWLPALLVYRILMAAPLPTAADVPRLVELTLHGMGATDA